MGYDPHLSLTTDAWIIKNANDGNIYNPVAGQTITRTAIRIGGQALDIPGAASCWGSGKFDILDTGAVRRCYRTEDSRGDVGGHWRRAVPPGQLQGLGHGHCAQREHCDRHARSGHPLGEGWQ